MAVLLHFPELIADFGDAMHACMDPFTEKSLLIPQCACMLNFLRYPHTLARTILLTLYSNNLV